MKVLYWKQLDWSGREFGLRTADQPVGKLTFKGWWSSFNAVYTSGDNHIRFKNEGWFEQDVVISYNGEVVGKATSSLFGNTTLRLRNGETYSMKGEAFTYNRKVLDETGNVLISYKQPTFSFGKGEIGIADEVPELSREVLVSTSLYLKAVAEHRVAFLVIIFMPILVRNFLH